MIKKRRNRIFLILLTMFLMVSCSVAVQAYTQWGSEDGGVDGYESIAPMVTDTSKGVYDLAGLLSQGEIDRLERQIKRVEKKKDYRILVVTTAQNSGTSMAFADDFFDFNDFGPDGVVFLLDMDNRDQWISTSGICQEISDDKKSAFSQGDIENILDETTPEASAGDYYQCLANFVNEVKKHGNLLYTLIPTGISLLISLGLAAAVLAAMMIQHKTVAPVNNANIRVETQSFRVGTNSALFLGAQTLSRRIPRSNGGGMGGGGGGGMHMGGSGTSHGGGGRGF